MAKQLPPILAELRRIFVEGIRRIDNDECSDSYAMGMISRFNAESKGFYDKDSLVNYDKAMKILNVKNRNKFNDLCKRYHIEQKHLNNMPVGLLKAEIEDLAVRLSKEKGD